VWFAHLFYACVYSCGCVYVLRSCVFVRGRDCSCMGVGVGVGVGVSVGMRTCLCVYLVCAHVREA